MSGHYVETVQAMAQIGVFRSGMPSRRAVLAGVAAAWLMAAGAPPLGAAEPPAVTFRSAPLTLHTAAGALKFTVELAETDAQRTLGLMFRTALAADRGMLFDFERPTYIGMWMRNTLIPLDMLFFDAEGRLTFIRENTTPGSLEVIQAPERNRFVLELAGGSAARLGIRLGDRVDRTAGALK